MEHKHRYGLKECDEFFKELRFDTLCKGKTFNEFRSIPLTELKEYEQRYITKYGDKHSVRLNLYQIYYGSVSNFLPLEAYRIYKHFNAKSVIDPFAGWGGRCFGAMMSGCNYTGFDTNTDLEPAYRALIQKYNTNGKQIQINFTDSSKVDFTEYSYDLVLTSPPYYKREIYSNMPEYSCKVDFCNMLKTVIRNVYNGLQNGGWLCINVPQNLYSVLVDSVNRECDAKTIYRKHKRFSTCEKTDKYTEYIYYWVK
jgi:hypothetical protein